MGLLEQGFSILAALTFGAGSFIVFGRAWRLLCRIVR